MIAALFHQFGGQVEITSVPDPSPSQSGVVLEVISSGICRSDWHGWQGHDQDIVLPHVPGHELVGKIVEKGSQVNHWIKGQIVTVPFVGGCGSCPECRSGNQQVCDNQFQPGFTGWGSFAEYVAIDYADENLVLLPPAIDPIHAASLGCRFITAFRGLVHQANVTENDWVAVHGCGGVGMSCIMIAKAFGAKVIAVDIDDATLLLAAEIGADFVINGMDSKDVVTAIHEINPRGVNISVDALGHKITCLNSINSLAKGGQHIQIGLLDGEDSSIEIPLDKIVANELQIKGSHGMQASRYSEIFNLMDKGLLPIEKLISEVVDLKKGVDILQTMNINPPKGIAVIRF